MHVSHIICAGNGGLIDSCRFYGNSGESCINAGLGMIVSNCVAYSNTLTFAAIYVKSGSSVINCNVQSTSGSAGYIAESRCTFGELGDTVGANDNIVY